ncbi:MAG TPA: hypothetical protein VGD17_08975 [Chitinophagaceae bacterium]
MDARIHQISQFFDHYDQNFNAALNGKAVDIERTANLFSNCFIEVSPAGITCGQNNEQFREAIPKGYEYYKSIGITSMNIISKETTLIDEFHSMVKIGWRSDFNKKDNTKGTIEFEVIYFLQAIRNENRIFAYITGDEQKVLKENGLI